MNAAEAEVRARLGGVLNLIEQAKDAHDGCDYRVEGDLLAEALNQAVVVLDMASWGVPVPILDGVATIASNVRNLEHNGGVSHVE